jgi:predicted sulfurtransferase
MASARALACAPKKPPTWPTLCELATVSFYRVCAPPVPVSQLRARVDHYTRLCEAQKVVGTMILAPEGMNGSLAGVRDSVRQVLHQLANDRTMWADRYGSCEAALPPDLVTNEEVYWGRTVPFARLKVKVKEEIIALKLDEPLDLRKRGTHVDPKDWDELISRPDVVVLDTRNDYESALGSFRAALKPDKGRFADFPEWVAETLPAPDGEGARKKVRTAPCR